MASKASVNLVWFSSSAANIRIISSIVILPMGLVGELEAVVRVRLDMASLLGGRIIGGK
jgi:hypothetical protein